MSAVEVDIADAVAAVLNLRDFGVEFTAEFNEADPTVPLEKLNELRVDIVPWMPDVEPEDRGEVKYSVQIDVLIRKRFNKSHLESATGRVSRTETSALRKLRQDITEFFMPSAPDNSGTVLTAVPTARWQDTKVMSGLVRGHLKQHHQFTGWIRLTFDISKAAAMPPLKS